MTLSEKIAALRTGLGLSQGDVAEKLWLTWRAWRTRNTRTKEERR